MKNWLVVLVVLLGASMVIFHRPLSRLLKSEKAISITGPEVARVEKATSGVQLKLSEQLQTGHVREGESIGIHDTLMLPANSYVDLRFASGLLLRVKGEASAVFDREELGPAVITLLMGTFEVKEPGESGRVLVVSGGIARDPMARLVTEEEEKSAVVEAEETLTNEYIGSVVTSQVSFLRDRCYAKVLKDQPNASGRVVLSFLIQQSGDLKKTQVLSTAIKNPEFEKCLVTVLERAHFKPFKGEPILVNYPILFE